MMFGRAVGSCLLFCCSLPLCWMGAVLVRGRTVCVCVAPHCAHNIRHLSALSMAGDIDIHWQCLGTMAGLPAVS